MEVYNGYTIERVGSTWCAIDGKGQIMPWSLSRTRELVQRKIDARGKR